MGIEVEIPDSVVDGFKRVDSIVLEDGRIAEIRQAKGKDLIESQKMATKTGLDENDLMNMVMTRVIRLSGIPLKIEDLNTMSLSDLLAIQALFSRVNFKKAAQPVSVPEA